MDDDTLPSSLCWYQKISPIRSKIKSIQRSKLAKAIPSRQAATLDLAEKNAWNKIQEISSPKWWLFVDDFYP